MLLLSVNIENKKPYKVRIDKDYYIRKHKDFGGR